LRNLLNESKNFSKNEEIEMEIERRESTGENNNTKKLDPFLSCLHCLHLFT